MYQVKYSTVVRRKVPIINGAMLGLNYMYFIDLLQAINAAFNLLLSIYKVVAKRNSNIIKSLTLELF